MKIIFLDIDGVLNIIPQGRDEFGAIFHQHFIDNLARIIDATGAKIVVSSSWRYSGLKVMQEMWVKRKYPRAIIDTTPFFSKKHKEKIDSGEEVSCGSTPRGEEIQDYLNAHANITQYVILDDDEDMLPNQMNNFVRTSKNQDHQGCVDAGYGLTNKCTEGAIKILLRET